MKRLSFLRISKCQHSICDVGAKGFPRTRHLRELACCVRSCLLQTLSDILVPFAEKNSVIVVVIVVIILIIVSQI